MNRQERPLVVVLGGINMDLVTLAPRFPEAGETIVGTEFLTYPGGKGANQALAAARTGARVAMVGRIGNDIFGPQAIASLSNAGVDVTGVTVSQGASTGIAVINIDESAQNRIIQVLGANDTCGDAEAERVLRLLDRASVLLLQLEVSVELSLRVAQGAAARGTTVILDPSPVRPIPSEFYSCCHIITPNETDAQALVGTPVVDRASAALAAGTLLNRGIPTVVVKLGPLGAYYATQQGGDYLRAFPVEAVDSVGAGDAFNGALAVAIAEGSDLTQAVRMASAAGALAVTRVGAQDSMPFRQEVDALLRVSGF